jgi:hypothetical protein
MLRAFAERISFLLVRLSLKHLRASGLRLLFGFELLVKHGSVTGQLDKSPTHDLESCHRWKTSRNRLRRMTTGAHNRRAAAGLKSSAQTMGAVLAQLLAAGPGWATKATAIPSIVLAGAAIFALSSLADAKNTRHGQVVADLSWRWDDRFVPESVELFRVSTGEAQSLHAGCAAGIGATLAMSRSV